MTILPNHTHLRYISLVLSCFTTYQRIVAGCEALGKLRPRVQVFDLIGWRVVAQTIPPSTHNLLPAALLDQTKTSDDY